MTNRTIAYVLYALAVLSAVLIVGARHDEMGARFGGGARDVSLGELWFSVFALVAGLFVQFGWPLVAAWLERRSTRE